MNFNLNEMVIIKDPWHQLEILKTDENTFWATPTKFSAIFRKNAEKEVPRLEDIDFAVTSLCLISFSL